MRSFSTRRVVLTRIGVVVAAAALIAGGLIPTAASAAASPSPAPAKHHHTVAMGTYKSSAFAEQAAHLPKGLATALKRDLKLTPSEYLADAAAATQAVKVVASLKSAGVHVLGSRMHGTSLTVNVASAAEKAIATAAGAIAVVGKPAAPVLSHRGFKSVVAATPTYGGEGWFGQSADEIGTNQGFRCSIGFSGYSSSAVQFATAGHCAVPLSGNAKLITQNAPSNSGGTLNISGPTLGATVSGEAQFGGNMDYGIVGEGSSTVPQASLYTWGGGTGAPLASAALPIVGQTAAVAGANLCKSGATSGWTCGVIRLVDQDVEVADDNGNPNHVNGIVATTCLLPGDSGGGAVIGQSAAGIDSGSSFPTNSCSNPNLGNQDLEYQSVFFPMVSAAGLNSVTGQVDPNWKLLAAPVVTSPASGASVAPGSSMTGTLFNPQATAQISLYFDGSSSAFGQVPATSGDWSIPLSGLPSGRHSYSVVETVGGNQVAAVSGSLLVPVPVAVRGGVGDFSGDGYPDVIVRDGNGTAFLYPGNGGTGFQTRVQLTAVGAWANMTAIVAAGDLNGDGKPDAVTRDQAGTLWLYPNNGTNGFGARIQLGATSAFAGMTAIQGVGDLNGDGHADLVARTSSGTLLLYPGNGTGTNTLGTPTTLATGWGSFTGIMGIGDFDGDGKSDILARDSAGALWLYPGLGSATGTGASSTPGFGPRAQVGGGWQGITIQAIGDFNNDGHEDIFVRDANGALFLYPGTGKASSPFLARVQVGGGWQGLTIAGDASSLNTVPLPVPAAVSGGVGDFNGDGNSDVVVRDGNGTLFLYPGNGGTGFNARVQLSAAGAWAGMTAIVAAGDLDGDGNPDIVARDHGGTLWLYPGRGTATTGYTGGSTGGFGTRVQLGATGAFMAITAIQGVGDLNGDGHADLIARDTSGNLLLYPGNGTGTNTLGAPTTLATGWGTYTGIMGIGDFDGDGKSDVLARDSAGALWLYPGLGSATGTGASPTPGFGPRVQVGGGWQGITIQAIGDFNNDGHEDIFVRDANGALFLYPGTGIASNPFLARIQVGGGWQGLTIAGDAASITPLAPPVPAAVSGGVGDFNGDGNSDVIVRDGNGTMFLYPGNGGTGFLTRVQLTAFGAWSSMTAIVAAGDLNGDGKPDIVARDGAGTLFLYPGLGNATTNYTGAGTGGFGTPVQLGTTGGFAGASAIQGVGDFDGDGHADLIARFGDGITLYSGPITGNSFTTSKQIASGWSSFTGIMGIGDFDGDGKSDVLARDSAGALWLYPGLGSGTTTGNGFGTRIQVGGGWQGITIQAIGDFDNDGHEDIFVRDANGALWLYPGTGVASTPFGTRYQVGGGWQGLTIAGDAATLATVAPIP